MEHVAIDLGGRESQICVRSDDGTIVEEKRLSTRALGRWLAKRSPSRVVVETCAESFAVADAALAVGHQVRVVPATLVRSLGVGSRRTKTDRRDAQILSEVSCRIDLPSVHVPTKAARGRKSLCGMRDGLVQARTALVNTVRGWARTQGLAIRSGAVETFPARVLELLGEDVKLPDAVLRQLQAIDGLSGHIEAADRDVSAEAKADPVCVRLMSVPGVGPVTSLRFVAAVDVVDRFANAHDLEAYLGLVPGENSSSERKQRTGITKAGAPAVRWALVQAAWSARRARARDPMVQWAAEVEKRRGKRIAVVALARKMAGVLYALWRDGSTYDARRGADASAPEVTAAA